MTYQDAAMMIWPGASRWPSSKCRKKFEQRNEKDPAKDGPSLLRRVQSAIEGRLKPIAHWLTQESHARLVRIASKKTRPRKPCGHKGGCGCNRKREEDHG